MTTDWQSLSNLASVVGAAVTTATAVSLAIVWLRERRKARRRKLVVSIERPENDLFILVVRYTPDELSQAHFVDIGSLGSNPIFLLPRTSTEQHRQILAEQYSCHISWPKSGGQWVTGRLHRQSGDQALSTKFQIVPEMTNAAGWLHVRVFTKAPVKRTVARRRVAVSLID